MWRRFELGSDYNVTYRHPKNGLKFVTWIIFFARRCNVTLTHNIATTLLLASVIGALLPKHFCVCFMEQEKETDKLMYGGHAFFVEYTMFKTEHGKHIW